MQPLFSFQIEQAPVFTSARTAQHPSGLKAIHPFTDGNGRTARVLNSLSFISEGLLTLPILYLSRYIIQHKADYYRWVFPS